MSNQGYKVIDIKDDIESGSTNASTSAQPGKHYHNGKECNHDHGHGGHSHGHSHSQGHSHGHSHGGHSHGHSHGHDDGHGHGHGHGGGKWFLNYGLQIKMFCYLTVIGGWTMIVFWFNEPMKEEDPVAYWTSNALITFLITMANISYYKCSNAKMNVPIKNTPQWASPEAQKPCDKCGMWKAERTHHCSACNRCNIKMDHHCPWITNCVGYHNHKAFWLYCFYVGMCGLVFDYKSIVYFFEQTDNEQLFEHSLLFIFWWLVELIAIVPFGMMVIGLSMYHFNFALNNMTTLESMGGYNTRLPCEDEETIKRVQNKYDKGLLSNLCDFFHNDPLLFWWPTIHTIAYHGQVHSKQPMIGPEEMILFLRGGNKEYTPEEKLVRPTSLAEVRTQEIFELAANFTSDKHLQFLDKMLEVGVRKDQTEGTVPILPKFMYIPPGGMNQNMPPEFQQYAQQQMLVYQQKLAEMQRLQLEAQKAAQAQQAQSQTEQQQPQQQIQRAQSPTQEKNPSPIKIQKQGNEEFELETQVTLNQALTKSETSSTSNREPKSPQTEDDSSKGAVVIDQKSESTEKIEKSQHSEISAENFEYPEKENDDFQVHEEKNNEKEDQ